MHANRYLATSLLAYTALLSACGGGGGASNATDEQPVADAEQTRTCENLRPEVIRVAAVNGVTIVKIYDPETVKTSLEKVSCSGRAMVSSGQEAKLYYRAYRDGDGDWLVQYAEEKLD